MGKPIVITDNVGCCETVEEGINGFLCQPSSTESLVEILGLMVNLSHQERLNMYVASNKLNANYIVVDYSFLHFPIEVIVRLIGWRELWMALLLGSNTNLV